MRLIFLASERPRQSPGSSPLTTLVCSPGWLAPTDSVRSPAPLPRDFETSVSWCRTLRPQTFRFREPSLVEKWSQINSSDGAECRPVIVPLTGMPTAGYPS